MTFRCRIEELAFSVKNLLALSSANIAHGINLPSDAFLRASAGPGRVVWA
jgi:hypothetical protein